MSDDFKKDADIVWGVHLDEKRAQQKGETMPKGEGRPTLTFDGAGYHCARCGSSQIALCEHWQALFERAHAAILLGQPTTALGKLRELVALANKWETLSKGYVQPEPLRDATWQACADELRAILAAPAPRPAEKD